MISVLSHPPRLVTDQVEPLHELEEHLIRSQCAIERWFRCQWQATPPPLYGSVDLRNAGFKLAPIDTNLFPAGFNNLNPEHAALHITAIQHYLDQYHPSLERLLLLPENHTRNLFYLENVGRLAGLLREAGLEVRLGSWAIGEPLVHRLASGEELCIEVLQREGSRLRLADFDPELILLNNDLSGGVPELLQGIEQEILPPLAAGWQKRRKSQHFAHYRRLAVEFAEVIDIDPWLIDPFFRRCSDINFLQAEGLDCLVHNVDAVLAEIRERYQHYGITARPFVIVKADAGTYGMGVMTAYSGAELRELNRKARTRMAKSKEGLPVSDVFIQEGVYTFEQTPEDFVAEPVVYLFGQQVLGGFFRVHREKGVDESLNAPGAHFEPMAFAEPGINPCRKSAPDAPVNRYYAYGVIARLALLAAAREAQDWRQAEN
ncbi:glutamate--cysteine ligase [Candidatus Igneacidithiobacillus taiwanensis]|uniref:glutamate--cysteine ligase n=1 Tax=Candidatus Igneacidithiobacillus taiwanensis TaxID=1945924 RepID=UPI0028967E70|nr:glutamate--cysteine ligase [Candidatus Igneacidithiobacillus taiwanensis]